ncbi:acetate--CoA ligase family protein [Bordetella genomosp. 5]|uniref:Acyl-CoA synthetase n=1 Tax=Bordetella genomosp. 5 TaxID=1395608 RepID=A0A261U084_9BORD|nr:acetate--CoA ligase family protein [Bordetella genomosp. 5]OZI55035.1 acyl-CoA synthetase [Bordetella genomosp. 5]
MTSSQPGTLCAQALLAPASVALVGASADPAKNTARPLRFMRKHRYGGRVYPINPARDTVLGERAWPTLDALPEAVEHVFIMVPGAQVEALLEPCARAGARVVTVYSDGFAESDEAGRLRQEALVRQARALGLRLLGPNSIGCADLHGGAILSVNAVFEADDLIPGDISLVSQSGSMMGSLLSRAAARGFGFARSVSVGNEADISVGEVVDALVDDAQTRVILLFMETLRDAPAMARALARARAAGKPVIAYKLGQSAQGDALASTHTGALAGNDAAVDAFLRAHGVMRVRSLEALFELAPLARRYQASRRERTDAPRVAVITTTGGGAATVVDNLGLHGLVAVAPPPDFIARMAERGLRLRETPVIDLTLAATSTQYRDLLEALLRADWCDAVLSVAGSSAQFHPQLVVEPLEAADKPVDKPLAVFLAPDAPQSLARLREAGIAAFRTPEACADALAALLASPGRAPADPRTWQWPSGMPRNGMLTEHQSSRIFASLGVPVARAELVSADAPAHSLAYPVVAKISSPDIAHKTDIGAVRVNLRDAEALRAAAADIQANVARLAPAARIDGLRVQEMRQGLAEFILGYRDDPLAGPTVLLGAGGIHAELAPDIALRLAPIDEAGAWEMIHAVRHTRLVRGFRGLPPGDCAALARAIADFSQLAACTDATIAEAEINPLFVCADGVIAVDGLLRLSA